MNIEQIEKESWEYANNLYPNPDRHNAPYTTEHDLQDAAYQHYKQGRLDSEKIHADSDKELTIVHKCLSDLYDCKYNNENDRIERIRSAMNEIKQNNKI